MWTDIGIEPREPVTDDREWMVGVEAELDPAGAPS